MKSLFAAVVVAMLISGCHDKNTPKPIAPQTGGVIPQAQLDALNKAKNVEAVLKEDAQRQRDQADQQSQ